MKKTLKIFLFIFLSFLIIIVGFLIYCTTLCSGETLDEGKLVNVDKRITFLYANGEIIQEEVAGVEVVEENNIPSHVKNAFIAIEDKRFYKHHGVDVKGLLRATAKNVATFSFKEGASTISQQLIKNTHLSNEKTLRRKVSEIKLSLDLEKKYSKEEILEKYLNTIYFGSGKYGISEASKYFFSKTPNDLTINEGAILASVIKAPSIYSPIKNQTKCLERKNAILKEMLEQNYITHNQYENNVKLPCEINICNDGYSHMDLIKNDLNEILEDTPYYTDKIVVKTSLVPHLQKKLEEKTLAIKDRYSAVLLNKNNDIEAFVCSDIIEKRQVGSTIKPIAVYAPAIESDLVYTVTKILDDKTNFNGYTPSNYGDKYYGQISVKESLEKSLNTCAVKILNEVGVQKAIDTLKKMSFPITDNDNSLALALGATENGATLTDITSCYNVFLNNGEISKCSVINKIIANGKLIYEKQGKSKRVFSEETTTLMNDMLLSTAKKGTAKKLSALPFPLYSKTGTVGNEKGNTDAYSISYNSEHVLGVWLGNKKGEYLVNTITGGGLPTEIAKEIWLDVYSGRSAPKEIEKSDKVCEAYIDKISYDKENIVVLADKNAPERYKIKALFKVNAMPKETSFRFSFPSIQNVKIEIVDDCTKISYSADEWVKICIYRDDGKSKKLIFDSKNDCNVDCFIDSDVESETEYLYSIIPYFENGREVFYGEEISLTKIKTPPKIGGDDWWLKSDDFG